MKKIILIVLLLTIFICSCKKNKNEEIIITYHINEETKIETYKGNDNELLSIEVPTGYLFDGWVDKSGSKVESFPNASMELFAKFIEKTYIVTFNNDGVISTFDYKYNRSVTFPDCKKEGFSFLGWTLDENHPEDSQIVSSYNVTDNVTFYAVYVEDDYIQEAVNAVSIPDKTDKDITLPTSYKDVTITWKSNSPALLDTTGKIKRSESNVTVTIYGIYNYKNDSRTVKYSVVILKLTDAEILQSRIDNYEFDSTIKDGKVTLKTNFASTTSKIITSWTSNNPTLIDDDGNVITYPSAETTVKLTLKLELNDAVLTKDYEVVMKPISFNDLVDMAIEEANIDTVVTTSEIYLPTHFSYNINGTWESSNTSAITDDGKVCGGSLCDKVSFKLTLTQGDKKVEKDIDFLLYNKDSLVVEKAPFMNSSNMDGVHVEGKYLVLDDDKTSGTYESNEITTKEFVDLVPTWVALSSKTATVLFSVQVYANGSWSKYFTYSDKGWGLGLQNGCHDQSDSVAKLDEDTIVFFNSKKGTKVRYKVVLERTSLNDESPKLSMVTLALTLSNVSTAGFDLSKLPSKVLYDVPKLYQREVPSIGGIICSATSSTMLLNYKGFDFSSYDTYEHRYIAGLVKDYGNNMYGNWTYNCVGMSAFGVNAYFARLSGNAELAYHLAYIGPCAISVKGTMTSDVTSYSTAGHLLVLKGYTYVDSVLTFIANDPNVLGVECKYSNEVITNTWRNAIYVVE